MTLLHLRGCLWAALELTLVRGEKQKPGNGAGTVKKVAMVEFYWCWFMFRAANVASHSARNPSLIYSCIVI